MPERSSKAQSQPIYRCSSLLIPAMSLGHSEIMSLAVPT
jgi:hypothetical protein